jgi:hypothetical protein
MVSSAKASGFSQTSDLKFSYRFRAISAKAKRDIYFWSLAKACACLSRPLAKASGN